MHSCEILSCRELICHVSFDVVNYYRMTGSSLFVRIRNTEGKYLGGEANHLAFYDDIKRAVIFDCRRTCVEQQLEYLRLTQGMILESEPVDPKEIYETCDRCGRLAFSFQMFFDGERYLCGECRGRPSDGSSNAKGPVRLLKVA